MSKFECVLELVAWSNKQSDCFTFSGKIGNDDYENVTSLNTLIGAMIHLGCKLTTGDKVKVTIEKIGDEDTRQAQVEEASRELIRACEVKFQKEQG